MKNVKTNLIVASLSLLAGTTGAIAADGDFNGDGFADFVVAAPDEDIGSIADSGAVWIFYGGASGIQMSRTIGPDPSTLGATLIGKERMGDSLSVGNFNGDAYDDVAIGFRGQIKVGGITHKSAVAILFGSVSGLNPASVTWKFFDDDGGAGFGHSLAAGDYNGDGKDDLAVGAPYTTIYKKVFNPDTLRFDFIPYNSAGRIWMYTSSGATPLATRTSLDYGTLGVPYDQAEFSSLGEVLAAGDFNGDGKFDLAAGAPYHDGTFTSEGVTSFGAVHVIYGSSSGLAAAGRQILRPGVELNGAGGKMGSVMVAGKFNKDASWDLALGSSFFTPGSAGSVSVLMGSTSKFKTDKSETIFTQETPGMLDTGEVGDGFGSALAVGRLNGDVYDDLVVGIPGEAIGSTSNAGAVQIIYSKSDGTGLSATNNQFLFQHDSLGIGGSPESGDRFGLTVAATRKPIDRTGAIGNVIIGVPFEDVNFQDDGMIHVLRGGTSGVVGTGQVVIHQDTASVPGACETIDRFGSALGAR